MPKLSGILCIFVLFLFAVVAHSQGRVVTSAQVGSGAQSGKGGLDSSARNGVAGGVIGGYVGSYFGVLDGAKGLPFSADVIDETDKFLADGNHIHRESHGKIFRDSEGRSRTENGLQVPAGRITLVQVQIFDPVQNVLILLNPWQKLATVQHFGGVPAGTTQFRPAPPAQPGARTASDRQAQVQRSTQSANDRRAPSFEDLGTMEIEGFTVKGTRFTNTIPAGLKGNDQPMITTREYWSSAELQTDLLIKSFEPEFGQQVHKLLNIRTGDPDPLLFQVPADYTIKDSAQR